MLLCDGPDGCQTLLYAIQSFKLFLLRMVFLLVQPCTNAACLYLHSIGAEEDSFSKDEEAAVHTRYYIHAEVLSLSSIYTLLGKPFWIDIVLCRTKSFTWF